MLRTFVYHSSIPNSLELSTSCDILVLDPCRFVLALKSSYIHGRVAIVYCMAFHMLYYNETITATWSTAKSPVALFWNVIIVLFSLCRSMIDTAPAYVDQTVKLNVVSCEYFVEG